MSGLIIYIKYYHYIFMLRTAEGEGNAAVWRTAARCESLDGKSEKKPPKS